MNKLLVALMVVASVALADELPKGSKQYEAFYALSNAIGLVVECPPELQFEGVQTGCALYRGSPGNFASAVHNAIDTRGIPLGVLDQIWRYDADFKRYGRSYSLSGGGVFRVIYDANNGQVPNVTAYFTP